MASLNSAIDLKSIPTLNLKAGVSWLILNTSALSPLSESDSSWSYEYNSSFFSSLSPFDCFLVFVPFSYAPLLPPFFLPLAPPFSNQSHNFIHIQRSYIIWSRSIIKTQCSFILTIIKIYTICLIFTAL